jgi:hypothetical protein
VGRDSTPHRQGIWRIPPAPNPSIGKLKLMLLWDSLRGDLRFEKIVDFLAPKEMVSK